MTEPCLWDRSELAYDGLRSHSALGEDAGAGAELDLTHDQVAATKRQILNRADLLNLQNNYRRIAKDAAGYFKAKRQRQRNWCDKVKSADLVGFLEHQKAESKNFKASNKHHMLEITRRQRQITMESVQYYCNECQQSFGSSSELSILPRDPKHRGKAARQAGSHDLRHLWHRQVPATET